MLNQLTKIRKIFKILFEQDYNHISSKYYQNNIKLIEKSFPNNIHTFVALKEIDKYGKSKKTPNKGCFLSKDIE